MPKEPHRNTKTMRMNQGSWSPATAEDKAHPTSYEYPYTGCPIFVLHTSRGGNTVKEWCQQGEPGKGANHEGGHH